MIAWLKLSSFQVPILLLQDSRVKRGGALVQHFSAIPINGTWSASPEVGLMQVFAGLVCNHPYCGHILEDNISCRKML